MTEDTPIRAILFDKDGTLFDFHRSWSGWASAFLTDLATEHGADAVRLASRIGFDLTATRFAADSPAIAGSVADIADALIGGVPGSDRAELIDRIATSAAEARMHPAVPLYPLLTSLRDRGLRLGVATNDAEAAARRHLQVAGVADLFDAVLGYDSGFGAKPAPGMCIGFAEATDLPPHQIAMVGDSTHDLIAGRAAGMRTVAVLTGLADAGELAPLADVVLDDIGALPCWLDRLS